MHYYLFLQLPDGSYAHRMLAPNTACAHIDQPLADHLDRRVSLHHTHARETVIGSEDFFKRIADEAKTGPSIAATYWQAMHASPQGSRLRAFSARGALLRSEPPEGHPQTEQAPEMLLTMPSMTTLASTVPGCEVLVATRATTPYGDQACYLRGKVIGTPSEVLLADGRAMPGSTRAAALSDPSKLTGGKIKCALSDDGTAWTKSERGPVKLERFAGAVTPLAALSAGLDGRLLVETSPDQWEAVELAK